MRVALALATVVIVAVGGNPAVADPAYVGKSPYYTGCQNDAYSVQWGEFYTRSGQRIGRIELRYSPRCGTKWTRVTYDNRAYFVSPSTWNQNTGGTDQYTASESYGYSPTWTYMVEGRNRAACGGAHLYNSMNQWVAWIYVGCG